MVIDLTDFVEAPDRAVGMFRADVDVLDELHVRIRRQECAVGVVGLAGI